MLLFNELNRLITRMFVIVLLSVLCLHIQIYSQTKLKNNIISGLDALYNFNFQSADKKFESAIKNYPENPAGYHYKSISYLWYYLDSKDQADFDNFFAYTDTAIKKAEAFLDKDTSDVFVLYILGSVYANRTFAFTRDENYFDAIFSASKFYSFFSILLEKDSLYYDAYMVKGLYNFAISQAPQTWSWAINLSGMTGDKQAGLDYLEVAAKKGQLSKIDAQFYLSQINSEFLLNYSDAKRVLDNLIYKFPKNLLFRYTLANLYMKRHELKNASRYYWSVFSSEDTIFTQLKNYASLALGDVSYYQGNYEKAKNYYKYFLERSTDNHFKGITALKLGLSYLFEGDSISAILYFDKTSEGNDDLDEDVYAKLTGEEYLNKLPGSFELRLVLIKNMIDAGNFKVAIDSLEKFIELPVSDTLRAEAMLYFSEANYQIGKFKKSLEYSVAVFNFDDCEQWVKPFACYNAAKASRELKNYIDAKLFIDYANNFKDYFYENKLKDKLIFLSFLLEKKDKPLPY